MIVRTFIARLTHDSSRAVGRIMLAMTCVLAYYASAETECLATEIAILKSSSISAYDQAITGFKSTAPSGVIYSEYDLQGDLEQGRKLARKIRASEASLVVAVGLKAALAAKLEIVDIPIVYMMILDPSKHNLTAPNMTGTLLEIPAERQFKILRAFSPICTAWACCPTPATRPNSKIRSHRPPLNRFSCKRIPWTATKTCRNNCVRCWAPRTPSC